MKQRGYIFAFGPLALLVLGACGGGTLSHDGGGADGGSGSGAAGKPSTTGAAGISGGAGTTGRAGTSGAAGRPGTAGTMGGGAGTAGPTGGAGTTGAAGTSGTGAAGTGGRACLDTVCEGTCKGTSCTSAWTCDTAAMICTLDVAEYCGCDGKTFTASGSCPNRAFAYRGACDATAVSCDPRAILCKRIAPNCGPGEVPSVEGSCYGPCVPIASCSCTEGAACPAPDRYTCHMSAKRCGPFVN